MMMIWGSHTTRVTLYLSLSLSPTKGSLLLPLREDITAGINRSPLASPPPLTATYEEIHCFSLSFFWAAKARLSLPPPYWPGEDVTFFDQWRGLFRNHPPGSNPTDELRPLSSAATASSGWAKLRLPGAVTFFQQFPSTDEESSYSLPIQPRIDRRHKLGSKKMSRHPSTFITSSHTDRL